METTLRLTFAGLNRLGDDDIRSFIFYLGKIPENATPDQCKAIFSSNNPDPTAEFRAIAASKPDDLQSYLVLLRKSIFAELSQEPPAITISDNQKKLSQDAFGKALTVELSKLSQDGIQRISSAFSHLDTANADDTCDAYRVMLRVMYNMEGMPGTWFRRFFVSNMMEQK